MKKILWAIKQPFIIAKYLEKEIVKRLFEII